MALILYILAFLSARVFAQAELPAEAKRILSEMPGQKLTVGFVIREAILKSDSYRALESRLVLAEASRWRAHSVLDTQFSARYSLHDNQAESPPGNPFAPESVIGDLWNLRVEKYFATGTLASLEFNEGFTELKLRSVAELEYFESRLTLSLAQNLWRDAFGRATRFNLESSGHAEEALRFEFYEQFEQLTRALLQQFYVAWLAKAELRAAQENVERRQRLFSVTSIRTQRGTAEAPDLLQVKAALLGAKSERQRAHQNLTDQWRLLVTTLKFPDTFLMVEPQMIPLELDNPIEEAKIICEDRGKNFPTAVNSSTENSLLAKYDRRAKSAAAQQAAALNGLNPELQLFGNLSANGIDSNDRTKALADVTNRRSPAWSVGLQLKWPVEGSAEKAAAATARAEKIIADSQLSAAREDLKFQWLSSCSDLQRLIGTTEAANESRQLQLRRAQLDESRFRLGRSSILSVVQAGDDAASADINWSRAQVDIRLAAWKVVHLHDGFKKLFQELGVTEMLKR